MYITIKLSEMQQIIFKLDTCLTRTHHVKGVSEPHTTAVSKCPPLCHNDLSLEHEIII